MKMENKYTRFTKEHRIESVLCCIFTIVGIGLVVVKPDLVGSNDAFTRAGNFLVATLCLVPIITFICLVESFDKIDKEIKSIKNNQEAG